MEQGKGEDAQIILSIANCQGEEEGAELFHCAAIRVDGHLGRQHDGHGERILGQRGAAGAAHHLLAAGGSRGDWSRGKEEDAQIIFPIGSCLGEEEGAELFHPATSRVDGHLWRLHDGHGERILGRSGPAGAAHQLPQLDPVRPAGHHLLLAGDVHRGRGGPH